MARQVRTRKPNPVEEQLNQLTSDVKNLQDKAIRIEDSLRSVRGKNEDNRHSLYSLKCTMEDTDLRYHTIISLLIAAITGWLAVQLGVWDGWVSYLNLALLGGAGAVIGFVATLVWCSFMRSLKK